MPLDCIFEIIYVSLQTLDLPIDRAQLEYLEKFYKIHYKLEDGYVGAICHHLIDINSIQHFEISDEVLRLWREDIQIAAFSWRHILEIKLIGTPSPLINQIFDLIKKRLHSIESFYVPKNSDIPLNISPYEEQDGKESKKMHT